MWYFIVTCLLFYTCIISTVIKKIWRYIFSIHWLDLNYTNIFPIVSNSFRVIAEYYHTHTLQTCVGMIDGTHIQTQSLYCSNISELYTSTNVDLLIKLRVVHWRLLMAKIKSTYISFRIINKIDLFKII